ncbi:MAG: hypothetical protein AB1668_06415 [Nanoarchaeota archaeon]
MREAGKIYELDDQEYRHLKDRLSESKLRLVFEQLEDGDGRSSGVNLIRYPNYAISDPIYSGLKVGVKVSRKGICGNITICSWDSTLTSLLEELVKNK